LIPFIPRNEKVVNWTATNGFINAFLAESPIEKPVHVNKGKKSNVESKDNENEPKKEKEKVPTEIPSKKFKKDKTDTSEAPKPETPIPVITPMYKFTVETIPSRYSDEAFNVYSRYQATVHKEAKEKTPDGYINFLVTSPLRFVPPTKDSPHGFPGYGSFHQEYRLNGKLFMVGVIDILPKCQSSVYLFYDPDFQFLSPGILSALKEIEWIQTIGIPYSKELCYYYMGYYIHSCIKMRYKGAYSPSDLLCPETYTWHPLAGVLPLLEKEKYARFAEPPISMDDKAMQRLMNQIPMEYERRIIYMRDLTPAGQRIVAEKLIPYIPLVGTDLAAKLVYFLR